MKNLIYSLTVIGAIIIATSCNQPCPDCPEAPMVEEVDFTRQLRDTISNAKYDLWKDNWKNHGQDYIKDTLTRYFTMPTLDLTEFLSYPGIAPDTVAAARFELGLEITSTYRVPHIMLVGVDADGKSMTDTSKHQYIYDVSQPCPNSCGASSL